MKPFQPLVLPAILMTLGSHATLGAPVFMPQSSSSIATSESSARLNERAFASIETVFELPALTGDPFDYLSNDVRATLRLPDGKSVSLPAFFDGGRTWRVRHTPAVPGQYEVVSITRNGQRLNVLPSPRRFTVEGQTQAGFVRLDPRNRARFARGGARYFPIGHNQAWHSDGLPDIPVLFDKMGAAGENWSRVWMNHWDGKNLDWPKKGEFGTLDLNVARRWDAIVKAAQKNGIAFQLVLQHHGQYSSEVNSNWDENPYNIKNGGFLKTPEEFFTNAQAKELTKRKLRYTVARWGFSPSIAAWELWNEVQFTDAARHKQWDSVAAWHREMADFLRLQDVYGHLITTSASGALPPDVQTSLDFYQEHLYPVDILSALNQGQTRADLTPGKPFFVGEFGPSGVQDPTGVALHGGLWAGLFSGEAGAPQFWTWDDVEGHDLYSHFRAAAGFVRASGFATRDDLKKIAMVVSTAKRGDLSFGPGGDWGQVTQNEFSVAFGQPPVGIGSLSRYVQGEANRTLGPRPLVFHVAPEQNARFIVQLGLVSKGGAHLKLRVDGQVLVERDFPAVDKESAPQGEAARLAVPVARGAHIVSLENTGGDWASVSLFTLTDSAPLLGSYALSNSDFLAAWVVHRANVMAAPGSESAPASGQLVLPILKAGRYRATWWDTRAGHALSSSDFSVGNQPATLNTPVVARDVALFVSLLNGASR